MHLNNLCFILPADSIELQNETQLSKPTRKEMKHHQRRNARIFKIFRKSLYKFFVLKWTSFCGPRKQPSGLFHDMEGVQILEKVGANNPRTFSYAELYIGTKGFSTDEILGSGGFGRVYRAVLPSDGTVVAVKCLMQRGERFEKTFAAELVAVAHLRHRNLVSLRGWCVYDDQLLLVYEYMPNRSLDRVLFKRPENVGPVILGWGRRMKIIDGLATALFYLHEQLETQIIHRDVKTSNVMLDSNFNARLGDFGLARWLEHELDHQIKTPMKYQDFQLADTTRIGGTIGYLPPESFQRRGSATSKSDVFSFGIVVLEIVSGRRAMDLAFQDDQIILLDWIRRLSDEGMVLKAGDSRLPDGSYKLSDMERLIHLGLLCTLNDPQSRPNMKWVLEVLSGTLCTKMPDLPSFKHHPLYISLSSSSSSITTSRSFTPTVTTTTTTTSEIAASSSSTFLSAKDETIFATAEYGSTDVSPSAEYGSSDVSPSADYGKSDVTPFTEYASTEIRSSDNKSKRRQNAFPIIETPREISFKEIISATNNFADSRRIAEVDFGTAYHGILDNNHHVLVKRLGMKTCPALRIRFANELQNLGNLRHRNLVQLRGWCTEQGEMLVVYDYSATRLLSHTLHHFHHGNGLPVLKWHHRYNIVKSLASAIRYLHEEWDEQVIHRNITSSSINLDEDMNPRLGSFALAAFLTRNNDGHHDVADKNYSVNGIFGYMAPEYMECGEPTTMADVYSFGVVVLEVVSGQMAVDFSQPDVLLVKRVQKIKRGKMQYAELADWRMDGDYNHKELVRMVKLGLACTHSDPKLRPSIKDIVRILDGCDKCFLEKGQKKESREEWKQTNFSSLSLIRRIQALGVQ
ncbi:Receptor like protein kinase S.2 [Heracleum sosnowskyi]|uniref:Receptor like protein kinase S.2 n=1 Tax=Heracleum sosnowskyi TaxID=360622 RepID=A0AAD8HAG1_9APIA|nr:Receptor like protein kinase S.2 [Heracleum sosnowskyi]